MNKEAMKQLILEALSKRLGDSFHISIQEVLKTNLKLDGLVIMQDGMGIAPTIYLEPFYKDLESGASIDDVAGRILKIYFRSKTCSEHFDIHSLQDFGYVKDRLYVELINRHFNKELLQNAIHAMFLDDFAIIVRCMVDATEDGSASFLVHENHLKTWHADPETILSHAFQNTRELLGLDLRTMTDYLREACPDMVNADLPDLSLWIMTNKRRWSGAATVLFDDVLKDFAKEHGNFYVVFSSVHEVLLFPTPDNSNIDHITKINQDVNAEQVQADEVLGTKAYYYCKDRGFII